MGIAMSSRKHLLLLLCSLLSGAVVLSAPPPMPNDPDLLPLDLSNWPCRDEPGGSAKTPDGVERNHGKNRPPVSLAGLNIPNYETASFLQKVSAFEATTKGKRRTDLNAAERKQLEALEKEIVSFTGYLVMAYANGAETTNCKDAAVHDWHLEVFEKPADHPPHPGDPTPIVCEITPRTQDLLYKAGIRMRDLAAFIRRPDMTAEPTGHKAARIKLTGYLLWDDDHNGKADIGPKIETITAGNGYHHPWRSTAWEVHPVMKIEVLDGAAPSVATLRRPRPRRPRPWRRCRRRRSNPQP